FRQIDDLAEARPLRRRWTRALRSARPAREDLLAGSWVARPLVQALHGLDLLGGQAIRSVGTLALQRLGLESTCRRMFEHAVLHTVETIARVHHRAAEEVQLGGR